MIHWTHIEWRAIEAHARALKACERALSHFLGLVQTEPVRELVDHWAREVIIHRDELLRYARIAGA